MSNLNSTNKLTEFPPLETEEPSDGRFSLSKFMFWRREGSLSVEPSSPSGTRPAMAVTVLSPAERVVIASAPVPKELEAHVNPVTRKIAVTIPPYRPELANPSPDPSDGASSPNPFEARNVSNVLRRLTSLIAMGSNNQADLKKYWMPDSVSKECFECGEKFTTFRRKHHCRICGQIFCSRCCNQEIPGKVIGYTGDLRVCVYCCGIVMSYLRSSDTNADGTANLNNIQEDLQNRLTPDFLQIPGTQVTGADYSSSYRSLTRRKASTCYQEERFAGSKEHSYDSFHSPNDKPKMVWDWVSLKSLWDEMLNPVTGIDWATHRHNMMKYCHSCVVGSELVDWLLAQRKVTLRGQGIQIGQLLIDANLLECVSQAEQVFVDAYALYKPVQSQMPLSSVQESESSEPTSTRNSTDLGEGNERDWGQDPSWLKQIPHPEKGEEEVQRSSVMEPSLPSSSPSQTTDIPGGKPQLRSSNSMYAVDVNVASNTVSISKPKDDQFDPGANNTGPPAVDSDQTSSSDSSIPRDSAARIPVKKSSSTTETMTDEFLQKTLQSQKDKGKNMVAPSGWHSPHQLTTDSELKAFQTLCNSYVKHENDLLNQLLDSLNLHQSWADIILPIVRKVTEIVRPDVRNAEDEMDIRRYIQFKKLPGGKKQDCRIVNGVVCTKNIAHRHMNNRLKDPNILLIGTSIDYQRFENKFLSLEPLVMQENDYLKNTVARISALKPEIVMVEKTVSRLAQEFMLDQGITLIINVKPSVMERVCRLTQGMIWESADTPLGKPQLGLCHNFYLESFGLPRGKRKTLMFFDGCATHLGCTVLLRGGTHAELVKVKKIASFLMFVAYNWRLERSFHIDAFSMPPADEDVEQNSSRSDEFKDAIDDDGDLSSSSSDSFNNSFHKGINHIILCASPFLKYPLPYLETEAGRRCELRRYFPELLYWSPPSVSHDGGGETLLKTYISDDVENNNSEGYDTVLLNSKIFSEKPKICWSNSHEFLTTKLTSAIGSDDVQGLIADFRRTGSKLDLVPRVNFLTSEECNKSNASSWNTVEPDTSKSAVGEEHINALDPLKHQRLSVLFCSYSPISANAPYFCVNPWVVNMDMYGRNDISLGMFLERYCFRKTYLCPAHQCETPMLHHIRKFVHYGGCVEVVLRELASPILGSGQNILMWNWCAACRTVSPIVPMSVDGWSVSFAKYLELRFYGNGYSRRSYDSPCPHSLHQEHQQYFAQQNIVAVFKYSKIRLWEISLPQCPISVRRVPKPTAQLIEDVKAVAILGHGVFTNILEALSSLKDSCSGLKVEDMLTTLFEQQKTEKGTFRSKIEDIQVNLVSNTAQSNLGSPEIETHLWRVKDSIGFLKCNVAETIQQWNTTFTNFITQKKKEEKQAKDTSKQVSKTENEPMLQNVKELEDSIGRQPSAISDNLSMDLTTGTAAAFVPGGVFEGSLNDTSDESCQIISSGLLVPQDANPKRTGSPSPGGTPHRTDSDKLVGEKYKDYDDTGDASKNEKRSSSANTMKTLLSHFMSTPGQIVQTPWPTYEHHFPAAYSVLPIPVFENEPSSIVAFTLGSTEYNSKLKRNSNSNPPPALFTSSSEEDYTWDKKGKTALEEFQASVESVGNKSVTEDKALSSATDDERSGKKASNVEIQFSSASAKFYCRVYFADSFRQLRKACLIEGEEFYIRSLARCVRWAASGGKSGSSFCKTTDDRFVIKQMSRFESQSFLDFAPNYFEHMKSAWEESKPTVLVKILGVYRIGFTNFQTGAAMKMDILVMENLFYDRTITQKFDLKGSMRNRLANVTGKGPAGDLVLLDENLLNMSCENPIYIRPHTKTVLSLALSNDSRFLASQMVMDYSLLVGLDDKNDILIVGIIDYIRTFTWDKKIENLVKSSFGGQGKMPTVVRPTEYQTRFCEAMDRYFLLVPDRWLGLGLGIDG